MSAQDSAAQNSVQFEAAATSEQPRTGTLRVRGRKQIDTPHFVAISSKGCVPHLTPDNMRAHTAISSIYVALEDYAERLPRPLTLYSYPCLPTESPLRRFISLQDDALLILGPRRHPALASGSYNTATSINVSTPVGFQPLELTQYFEAAQKLRPDIVLAVPDIEHGKRPPGVNRRDRMDARTRAWVRGMQAALGAQPDGAAPPPSLWAPLLPIEPEMQRSYLDHLDETPAAVLGGLALHAASSLADVPAHLRALPRLLLTEPATPHDVLAAVELGADLLAIPFVSDATDAGLALTFSFPAPPRPAEGRLPLALDLAPDAHATDTAPLVAGCACYACATSQRAFVRHLLASREMLAWVLLQIHNHHVLAQFFAAVRASVAAGSLEADAHRFRAAYDSAWPGATAEQPRLRGYSARAKLRVGGAINKPAWEKREPPPESPKARRAVSEKQAEAQKSLGALDGAAVQQGCREAGARG